jgi:large subunit ribosomal protein L13
MKTTHVKGSDCEERWLLYDASEHILGRMATEIARSLMGKDRPTYTPSELSGAHVVVINAEKAVLTGRKDEQKLYQRYSGYPSGRKETPLARKRGENPEEIVTLAVRRMLPKTRLGKQMLSRLKVYAGAEHRHQAQKPEQVARTLG